MQTLRGSRGRKPGHNSSLLLPSGFQFQNQKVLLADGDSDQAQSSSLVLQLLRLSDMQRFLRQVVSLSGQSRGISTSSCINPPLRPFHPWRSGPAVFGIFRGSHSGPVLVRHFMFSSSDSLRRISGGRVGGFTPKLLRVQFRNRSFDFNRNFRCYGGGWRSWFKGLTPDNVALGLIAANVVVFLSWRMASQKFMSENFTISLHNISCGRLHTLITSAFSQIDAGHITSNMIGLYFFGTSIGRAFGNEYLLKLYLAGALGGSIFYLAHQSYKALTSKGWKHVEALHHQALGASGAVNAIMLLMIFLFPRSTVYLNFFIPVPSALVGIFLIGNDMWRIMQGDTHISGSAHLGGAAVAAVAFARIRKGRI